MEHIQYYRDPAAQYMEHEIDAPGLVVLLVGGKDLTAGLLRRRATKVAALPRPPPRVHPGTGFSDTGRPSLLASALAPEGKSGSALSPVVSDSKNSTFSSINASIYDPPAKLARPFEADYPTAPRADETGRLTHDIEGRPLTAKYVAGRRSVGGADEVIAPSELDAITESLFGTPPDYVPAGALHRGQVGRFRNMAGPDGPERDISVLRSLPQPVRERVLAHEISHGIEDFAAGRSGIPDEGLFSRKAGEGLGQVYHDLNDGSWRRGQPVPKRYQTAPRHFGYKGDEIRAENIAEALRAYMADPNYIKSVAPKTAARIREYVNSNPRLNGTIQFNSHAGIPLPPQYQDDDDLPAWLKD